ncbi:hypothetical protein CTAYLR_009815 [Chrysophaeum taylorii]|uniref:Inositol 1,4,5-trisphosphate/ryanodine receptor domain-containing protein n=1 Tax=Chrysophaeum taylorii TaxID=2483200 RepID=A0AAD7U8K0_9STRA|nr:hypothetical protein CTAYLR_009815 [Chrysophaeum taylorii]
MKLPPLAHDQCVASSWEYAKSSDATQQRTLRYGDIILVEATTNSSSKSILCTSAFGDDLGFLAVPTTGLLAEDVPKALWRLVPAFHYSKTEQWQAAEAKLRLKIEETDNETARAFIDDVNTARHTLQCKYDSATHQGARRPSSPANRVDSCHSLAELTSTYAESGESDITQYYAAISRFAYNEMRDNMKILQQLVRGEKLGDIVYGNVLHLQHILSGKFLVTVPEPAKLEQGCFGLQLVEPSFANAMCTFQIWSGLTREGIALHAGDQIQLSANDLTTNLRNPVRLARSSVVALQMQHKTVYEANLNITNSSARVSFAYYGDRGPLDATERIDVGQYIQILNRELELSLVASTNSRAKRIATRPLGIVGGVPYFRLTTTSVHSPGKGFWVIEHENPLLGSLVLPNENIRLRHASSGLYLAVEYAESPDDVDSGIELVSVDADLSFVPSHGHACLLRHQMPNKKATVLYLKAGAKKKGKDYSRLAVFSPKTSVFDAIEIKCVQHAEMLVFETILDCRRAINGDIDLINALVTGRSLGQSEQGLKRWVMEDTERILAHVIKTLTVDPLRNEARRSEAISTYDALNIKGRNIERHQTFARETKLMDTLMTIIDAASSPVLSELEWKHATPRNLLFCLGYDALRRCVLNHDRNQEYFVRSTLTTASSSSTHRWVDLVVFSTGVCAENTAMTTC